MHSAVQEGMNANNTSVGYRAAGVPVITFEQPGSRTITMQQAAIPSAPMLQLPNKTPGLWEQCRQTKQDKQVQKLMKMDWKLDKKFQIGLDWKTESFSD